MSLSIIARSLKMHAATSGVAQIKPDVRRIFGVTTQNRPPIAGDTFRLGCRFHCLLRRIADHRSLTNGEKALLPALDALRRELRALGVRWMDPELSIRSNGTVPGGVCDLVVSGGPARHGVVEIKVVHELPAHPNPSHLVQLGGYAALLAASRQTPSVWAAIAYVEPRAAIGWLEAFFSADELSRGAERVFATGAGKK